MNAPLRVWGRHERIEHPTPIVWHLSEGAETVCLEAVNLVRQRMPELRSITHMETLVGRPDFIGPSRCGLAVCLAKVLGANDSRVRAVFHYDQTDPQLHLLVLVTEPTAALHGPGALAESNVESVSAFPGLARDGEAMGALHCPPVGRTATPRRRKR